MSELLVVRHGQASLFADDYDVLTAEIFGIVQTVIDLVELFTGNA